VLLSTAAHAAQVDRPRKALVACRLQHRPGALLKALEPIAAHGLSITKIEGRPIPGTDFEYRFIIEMAAPDGESVPPAVYDELRAVTTSCKLLGAFGR
jgi:prephenate dehydratase